MDIKNVLTDNVLRQIEERIQEEFGITTRLVYSEYPDGVVELVDAQDNLSKQWYEGIQSRFFRLEGGIIGKVSYNDEKVVVDIIITYFTPTSDEPIELKIATYELERVWKVTQSSVISII